MWYHLSMEVERVESALKEAHAACRHSEDIRGFYARRSERESKQRQDDLHMARERVRLAMIPLRSYLGAEAARSGTRRNVELYERVRKASKALQAERRKLWKMQTPKGRAQSRHKPKKPTRKQKEQTGA